MDRDALAETAAAMVRPGKGLLAADESTGTIAKRFDAIGVENTEDNRRAYRELLFRATDGMRNAISGVILFDETLRQNAADGAPLRDLIIQAGAIPASRWTPASRRCRTFPARRSPRGSTAWRRGSTPIMRWARASPSGAR